MASIRLCSGSIPITIVFGASEPSASASALRPASCGLSGFPKSKGRRVVPLAQPWMRQLLQMAGRRERYRGTRTKARQHAAASSGARHLRKTCSPPASKPAAAAVRLPLPRTARESVNRSAADRTRRRGETRAFSAVSRLRRGARVAARWSRQARSRITRQAASRARSRAGSPARTARRSAPAPADLLNIELIEARVRICLNRLQMPIDIRAAGTSSLACSTRPA